MLARQVHAEVPGQGDGSALLGGVEVGRGDAEVGADGRLDIRDVDHRVAPLDVLGQDRLGHRQGKLLILQGGVGDQLQDRSFELADVGPHSLSDKADRPRRASRPDAWGPRR